MDPYDEAKQNANPLVLDPSQLPSRRRTASSTPGATARSDRPDSVFSRLLGDDVDQHESEWDHVFADPGTPEHGAVSVDNDDDDDTPEDIDEQEIYDLIAPMQDPEHPLTLGSLAVVNLDDITITRAPAPSPLSTVSVALTPTITHCSLATVIGLGVRLRLQRALPPRFRVDVRIKEGSHQSAREASRQLADKERVLAAEGNKSLISIINKMMVDCI